MIPPFKKSTDYLQLFTSSYVQGKNRINIRDVWIPSSMFVTQNVFVNIDSETINGEWIPDVDGSLPQEVQESRIFCLKGKASLTFTGTNISIRVGVNPTWGNAAVRIDGQLPSSIGDLTTSIDVLSCASESYIGQPSAQYLDILVVDGLTDTEHTIDLYCNNTSDGKSGFFIISGAKVSSFNNKSLERDLWIHKTEDYNNLLCGSEDIILLNKSGYGIKNIDIVFNNLVNINGQAIQNKSFPLISPNNDISDEYKTSITYLRTGVEKISQAQSSINISAEYLDSEGEIQYTEELILDVDSELLEEVGEWYKDESNNEQRTYTNIIGSHIQFQNENDSFKIRVQKDYGWGTIRVSKNPITKIGCSISNGSNIITVPDINGLITGQYLSMNANLSGLPSNTTITSILNNTSIEVSNICTADRGNIPLVFLNQITTISCHDEEGGQFYQDTEVVGCGTQECLIRLDLVETNGLYISLSAIKLISTLNYTLVEETLPITWNLKQMLPAPIDNIALNEGTIEHSFLEKTYFNIDQGIDNRNLKQYKTYCRYPTYCVVYKPGHLNNLKEYDIVVVDPFGISRSEVAELQSLGIKVLVYVSFGEEDGTIENVWDASSAKSPWTGDGQGPGGYASYYIKGGYKSGEMSECVRDNQRMLNQKSCALSDPHYFQETGRCSSACVNDWREGYKTWRLKGQCTAGHTQLNYWQRDATVACQNAECPNYTPIHDGCPNFQKVDNCWGQDFSILDQDFPDENGIWGSYYINAVDRGPGSWHERISQYYLPIIFGEQQTKTETLNVETHMSGSGPVLGVRVLYPPIDMKDNIFSVQYQDSEGFLYVKGQDYCFDDKLGTILLTPASSGAPPLIEGDSVYVTYVSKGLECDGVFMDTVDTVDVYPDEAFQQGMADLINDMKALYPEKHFCSNRGFTILGDIIKSCDYVMFETFLTDYDWEEDVYTKLTNQASIDWNNGIIQQLYELRKKYIFDVLALNYCKDSSIDDELRKFIREESLKHGFLSWSTEIMLSKLLPNSDFTLSKGPIRTNIWRLINVEHA